MLVKLLTTFDASADNAATPIVCLGGGTPHKPPIMQETGFVLHEGTELAKYLISQVTPHSRVFACPDLCMFVVIRCCRCYPYSCNWQKGQY